MDEVKAVTAATIKLAPDDTEMSHCTRALVSFFFFNETISIHKIKFQETKALFGVSESVEYETLQGRAHSDGKLTKVKC